MLFLLQTHYAMEANDFTIDVDDQSEDEVQVEAQVGGATRDPQNTETTRDSEAGMPASGDTSLEPMVTTNVPASGDTSLEPLDSSFTVDSTSMRPAVPMPGASPSRLEVNPNKRPLADCISEVEYWKAMIKENMRKRRLRMHNSGYKKNFRMRFNPKLETIFES